MKIENSICVCGQEEGKVSVDKSGCGQHSIDSYSQECGNTEPTNRHFDLFSPFLSCPPYTLNTVRFQFTRHSLDLWTMSCMTGCFYTPGYNGFNQQI